MNGQINEKNPLRTIKYKGNAFGSNMSYKLLETGRILLCSLPNLILLPKCLILSAVRGRLLGDNDL